MTNDLLPDDFTREGESLLRIKLMVITKLCALMITNFAKALGKGVTWVLGGGGVGCGQERT